MRILLTGSSGWLGRHLAPLLLRLGHEVTGLDPAPGPHTGVRAGLEDRALLTRTLNVHGIDSVIHAGGLHQPDLARRPESDFVAVNILGTQTLLEACAVTPVKRLVFTCRDDFGRRLEALRAAL